VTTTKQSWRSDILRPSVARRLGPGTVMVVLALLEMMSDSGEVVASQSELGEVAGLCVRSVGRAIAMLRREGWLHLVERGHHVGYGEGVPSTYMALGAGRPRSSGSPHQPPEPRMEAPA